MFNRIAAFTCSGSFLAVALVGCVDMSGSSDPSEPRFGRSISALMTQADCPSGSHVIIGTEGDDNIVGTNSSDCILGLGGNDTISGGNDNDSIFGGPGNDTINGGNGNDSIHGEDGNDVIDGDNGNDVISAGAGNDVVSGGNGNDLIQGNDGSDVIAGDNGNDALAGDAGEDTLVAGNGNDMLNGGDGLDTCSQTGSNCEQIESPPPCVSDSMCSSGQLCIAPVEICVSCPADSERYVDVDGWVDGPYIGAFANVNSRYLEDPMAYNEVGQSFVATASGTLAGVSFNCSRSRYDEITQVRVSVHVFDPASGRTGAQVGSGDFDVSSTSTDIFDPTDQFFGICGRQIEAGRSYLVSVAILKATFPIPFIYQANESYPLGGMWNRDSASDPVWQSYAFTDEAGNVVDSDVDFRIWLNSN